MIRLCAVLTAAVALAVTLIPSAPSAVAQPKEAPQGEYVNKGNRPDSARATLASHGLPNLEGKWYFAGPFDNTDRAGFDTVYPPEKSVDLKATYEGKRGAKVTWKEYTDFKLGRVVDLKALFPEVRRNAVVYLYHSFESE